MAKKSYVEPEWLTRKTRIDGKLRARGWGIVPFTTTFRPESADRVAVIEYPTDNGPADYALFVGGRILGIVEAKKLSLGPQNVEKAIAQRKRPMLVAMATGCGKTFTTVNQAYRLMKSGVARRVLFLVDRRALAAQAVRAFAAFEPEPGLKFDKIYEVYSQKFRKEVLEDDDEAKSEPFDPKELGNKYLTAPNAGHAFVYVCTIQRMAINLLGRSAAFEEGDDERDDEADKLDIPVHAFDCIIADECHRSYTSSKLSAIAIRYGDLRVVRFGSKNKQIDCSSVQGTGIKESLDVGRTLNGSDDRPPLWAG